MFACTRLPVSWPSSSLSPCSSYALRVLFCVSRWKSVCVRVSVWCVAVSGPHHRHLRWASSSSAVSHTTWRPSAHWYAHTRRTVLIVCELREHMARCSSMPLYLSYAHKPRCAVYLSLSAVSHRLRLGLLGGGMYVRALSASSPSTSSDRKKHLISYVYVRVHVARCLGKFRLPPVVKKKKKKNSWDARSA